MSPHIVPLVVLACLACFGAGIAFGTLLQVVEENARRKTRLQRKLVKEPDIIEL